MCSVEDCEVPARSHGMCRPHDHRMKKYGDPLGGKRVGRRRGPGAGCVVTGCEAISYPLGNYCSSHRYNLAKYGTTERPDWRKPDGYEVRDGHGYIRVMMRDHPMASAKGYIPKHRLVMAEHLGRSLTRDESVHHLNGDKTDNRIENLELWIGYGAQPSGQRPRDLVEWARKILDEYGDEVDSGLL